MLVLLVELIDRRMILVWLESGLGSRFLRSHLLFTLTTGDGTRGGQGGGIGRVGTVAKGELFSLTLPNTRNGVRLRGMEIF
jgi:hypothetical protein